jgi:hypothetical protein
MVFFMFIFVVTLCTVLIILGDIVIVGIVLHPKVLNIERVRPDIAKVDRSHLWFDDQRVPIADKKKKITKQIKLAVSDPRHS